MKSFCSCVLILLVASISVAKADFEDEIKTLNKKCQDEVHVTEEELQKFFKNGMKPADANEAIMCHIKCMLEKRGYMKDGKFDDKLVVERAKNIPKLNDHINNIAKAAADCKAEVGATECETAFKIGKCFKESKDALGIPFS